MKVPALLRSIPLTAAAIILVAVPAQAATAPAIGAFDEAFQKIDNYTVTITAHEVLGNRVQDRVYHYWFKRPSLAKTLIVSGDGSGSGGVWNGGDRVSGHQGGLLSFIHLKVGLHDGRAVSLRGYTIPEGLLQNEVDKYARIKGDLSQRPGPDVNGQPTDELDLNVADPAATGGVTRMTLYLSKSTRMPLRQLRYTGDQIAAQESFTDLKLNPGLTNGDFPF